MYMAKEDDRKKEKKNQLQGRSMSQSWEKKWTEELLEEKMQGLIKGTSLHPGYEILIVGFFIYYALVTAMCLPFFLSSCLSLQPFGSSQSRSKQALHDFNPQPLRHSSWCQVEQRWADCAEPCPTVDSWVKHCFKLLSVGMVCSAAIDNKYTVDPHLSWMPNFEICILTKIYL